MKDVRIISETDHYAVIRCPFDPYYKETDKEYTLRFLEQILEQGYRPIFYENRQHGFVCEKPGVRAKAIDKAA